MKRLAFVAALLLMAVPFRPLNRQTFAADAPTDAEARAALQG